MEPTTIYILTGILAFGPLAVLGGGITLFLRRKERHTSLIRVGAILAIVLGLLFSAGLCLAISTLLHLPPGSFGR